MGDKKFSVYQVQFHPRPGATGFYDEFDTLEECDDYIRKNSRTSFTWFIVKREEQPNAFKLIKVVPSF